MLDRGLARGLGTGWLAALLATVVGCAETIVAEGSREQLLAAGGATAAAVPFFRDPLLSRPVLSPSGEQIAAVHSKDGIETVIVRETSGGEIRQVFGHDRAGWSLRKLGWPGEDHVLVSVEMPHPEAIGVRARANRLLSVPLDGSRWSYLGEDWLNQEYTSDQDDIIDWLPDDPDHVLIVLRDPGDPGRNVYRLNVNTGRRSLVVQYRTSVYRWKADHEGKVRAGTGSRRQGTNYLFLARASGKGPFRKVIEFDPFAEHGFWFAGFSEDPEKIYVWSDRDTDRVALYTYDLDTRELGAMVHDHPRYDLHSLGLSRRDGRLLEIRYHGERPHQHIVDPQWKLEQTRIDRALPDTVNRVFGYNQDGTVAIVEAYADSAPPRYYLYRRDDRRLEFLFASYPDIDRQALVPMRSVSYAARDGLEIAAYLTLPRDVEPLGLPVIVYPHGGPTARDIWGYDPLVQFLASRGFAVFQPNFRGSTGYGSEHERRGYREWGLAMQDDITDGVRWLIDQGIADPARIGIYGASYGGYAALMGLVKTPDLFRAGASFAGVTDLLMTLDDDEWYGLEDVNSPTLGGGWSDRRRLIETSPTRQAHRIRAPVLIAHGTEDWRVHVRQAEAMADALRDQGKPVELYLYDKEVHGFDDERNRIDFHGKLATFFERHLLGASPGPTSAGEP